MKKFKKVLLIDDDYITNFINITLIKTTGTSHAIKVTTNGSEALDYLKNTCGMDKKYPDLIIVDINMPIMNGFDFLTEYAKLPIKEKPIIRLLSSSSDPRDIQMAAELGITMLSKPLTGKMVQDLYLEKNSVPGKGILQLIKSFSIVLVKVGLTKLKFPSYKKSVTV